MDSMTEWQSISTALDTDCGSVLVYQPAVRYRNGQQYGPYVTEASKCKDGRFYSETHNAILEPTHWMPLPEPPDQVVVESPAEHPFRMFELK